MHILAEWFFFLAPDSTHPLISRNCKDGEDGGDGGGDVGTALVYV